MSVSMNPRRNHRTTRTNVKSGCRTCKIRKVKCDEGRPACRRCISTGRVCDGYGIWGGGGSIYGHRQRLVRVSAAEVVSRPPVSLFAFTSDPEEKGYFEWFRCRTATKLPASFVCEFWTSLLLTASSSEPAVLHAVLALGSVHKAGIINADLVRNARNVPNEQERFMLRHYGKAINHLQPHFSTKDRTSFRVGLIACVVFICLEFLRGHFQTAQIHLQNGLKLLGEMQILSGADDGILHLRPCRESTDEWIVEAFSRLHLQVELFKHTHQHRCLVIQAVSPETPVLAFCSINEAWQGMDKLLNSVFYLTHQGRMEVFEDQPPQKVDLLQHQKSIQEELARWLVVYKALKEVMQGSRSVEEEKCHQLLYVYHTMTTIMADTCLGGYDESIFDSHTAQFIFLIKQSISLRIIASTPTPIPVPPSHLADMARSVVDVGWIPPLFYAAVKCRVHRIRLQAIRLLESTFHREGIWDAKVVACVARKVMHIEEGDFYKGLDTVEDFSLASPPSSRDLLLPTLPKSRRIREVEVVLSGTPMDKILLFCKQKQARGDCRVLLSEYDVRLQRWEGI
ncbi:hypothetical protein QQX98_003152 [Neonectria punicea]|uniref:Zn(2)-C6 fungal-type domain-containing protein n=1 Tax=Neonectria punicea TaxID=979145 RepID=A0ABR1HFS4_9HYPO